MTKAVVAICVLLVPEDAVGAVGVPVRDGDAIGAKYVLSCPSRRSALRLVLRVVEDMINGAVPFCTLELI